MIRIPSTLAARATCFRSREEWLGARVRSIGASEVAPLLGVSPYRGPWDVWTAKADAGHLEDEDVAPDEEDDDAHPDPTDVRVRGQVWEPWVRARVADALGTPIAAPGAPWASPDGLVVVHHPTLPWATCSPDGWLLDEGVLTVPELKTDAKRGGRWPRSGLDVAGVVEELDAVPVRPDYLLQVVWQMEVLDLPHAVLGVMLGSYRVRWYRVRRDRAFGRALLNAVAAWREEHLVQGEPPDLDASEACIDYMRARITAMGPGRGTHLATAEEAAVLARWGHARASRKDAEAVEQSLTARVLEIVGPHGIVRLPSGERVERNAAGHLKGIGFLSTRERKRMSAARGAAYADVARLPDAPDAPGPSISPGDDLALNFSLTA